MKKTTIPNLLALPLGTLEWLCENWLSSEGEDAPSKVGLRLPIGETFSRKANGTRGAIMPRQQVVFYHRFLNKYFML